MKRLKWVKGDWGSWFGRAGKSSILLTADFTAILSYGDSTIARTNITATTVQGVKRAAVQWAKRVVRELAKEWE